MLEHSAIVEDVNRCVGCRACEVVCKTHNNFPVNQSRIRVNQIGPERLSGALSMEYLIEIGGDCDLCLLCVSICPAKALVYCQTTQKLLEYVARGKSEVVMITNVKDYDPSAHLH